jgi:circadian clock protein KaiB
MNSPPPGFAPAFLDSPKPDAAGQPEYELHLYVAGVAPRSQTARRNLETICQRYLAGRHTLTIVDLHQQPEKAGEDEILGVPCLVKKRPGLVRRLVGDLSDHNRVLKVLGLG